MELAATPSTASAEATTTPTVSTEGLDVLTRKLIEGKSAEDAQKIINIRKGKASAKTPYVPVEAPVPAPEASPPVSSSEEIVLDLSEPSADAEAAPPTEEPAALSEAELAALSEKARKQYLDASKEAAKVRKRAQEAEAKLAKEQEALAARDAELEQLRTELQQRAGAGDIGFNVFAEIHATAQGVALVDSWQKNSQEAMKELQLRAMGKEDLDMMHKFPDGTERELTADDVETLQQRIDDAATWRAFQQESAASRDRAKPILTKLDSTPGYKDAYAALTRANVQTQLPEILAKAALYDALVKSKGRMIFPGEATAATNAALSKQGTESQTRSSPANTPAPPKETPSTAPRMVPEGSDNGTERSALKLRAMKSGRPEDIKAAIMAVGQSRRMA